MPISKRRLRSYAAAELTCRQLRFVVSDKRHETPEEWQALLGLLIRWMDLTGKHKYLKPAP